MPLWIESSRLLHILAQFSDGFPKIEYMYFDSKHKVGLEIRKSWANLDWIGSTVGLRWYTFFSYQYVSRYLYDDTISIKIFTLLLTYMSFLFYNCKTQKHYSLDLMKSVNWILSEVK